MAKSLKPVKVENNEGTVHEFLKGYVDKDGMTHVDFEIVEMTGEDEEAISKAEVRENGGKIIRTILERCITRIGTYYQKDMKRNDWRELIQELTVGDQDYALLKIREESIGNELEITHKCPACKVELNTVVETDELEIKPFSGEEEIEFELPKGYKDKEGKVHTSGKLRYPNGFDRELLDRTARNNMGMANTMLLTRCIIEFDGLTIYDKIVRQLSIKDREYLLKLLRDNAFGVDLETEVTCSSCGEVFSGNFNVTNFI